MVRTPRPAVRPHRSPVAHLRCAVPLRRLRRAGPSLAALAVGQPAHWHSCTSTWRLRGPRNETQASLLRRRDGREGRHWAGHAGKKEGSQCPTHEATERQSAQLQWGNAACVRGECTVVPLTCRPTAVQSASRCLLCLRRPRLLSCVLVCALRVTCSLVGQPPEGRCPVLSCPVPSRVPSLAIAPRPKQQAQHSTAQQRTSDEAETTRGEHNERHTKRKRERQEEERNTNKKR